MAGLSTAAHRQSRQRFTLEYAKLPSGRHLPCAPGNTAKRLALPGKGAEQCVHVQAPSALCVGHQRHGAHLRTQNARLRHQVGPYGRDQHHFVARVHQGLHGHHQAVHAARRDGDAVKPRIGVLLRVQAVHVACNRVAQFGQAQVMGIKGFTVLQ